MCMTISTTFGLWQKNSKKFYFPMSTVFQLFVFRLLVCFPRTLITDSSRKVIIQQDSEPKCNNMNLLIIFVFSSITILSSSLLTILVMSIKEKTGYKTFFRDQIQVTFYLQNLFYWSKNIYKYKIKNI